MREAARIERISLGIFKIWQKRPDLRFGQVVEMLCRERNMFYMEDTEWEARIKEYL